MVDDAGGTGEPLPLDLLEAGDPAFVDAIRAVRDADALADLAARWHEDRRPASRRLLFEYLDRPLNAFRHEGLVKRLFKRAEVAGDDEVMARFLVLFDCSVRRVRAQKQRWIQATVATQEEAAALQALWTSQGFLGGNYGHPTEGFRVWGQATDEVIRHPRGSAMPRGRMVERRIANPRTGELAVTPVPDWAIQFRRVGYWLQRAAGIDSVPGLPDKLGRLRLFSLATRNYLRRRAWRYFRKLGEEHPGRYVAAASTALALYRDEDAADGLALLDNWGLVHLLFHHSPILESRPNGWVAREGRSLAELAPAPSFEGLWAGAPAEIVGLLSRARSRPVRAWAIRRVEANPSRSLAAMPVEGWVDLLGHDDPEVASLAGRLLRSAEGLDAIEPARWLALAESASPAALDVVCELIGRHLGPDRVTLEQAARLAGLRPLPAARLGFEWLQSKSPRAGEADRLLLGLVEADCGPLRPEILRWLRAVLAGPASILEFLDSRHADARAEGWAWFLADPRARDDRETWRRLLESPHDDVRLPLVAELERREAAGGDDPSKALDSETLRTLWASVLLNVHRGSRAKPAVVRQLLRRLEARPDDAASLLPLLGVALRSVRGAERRAGLIAVVRLVEARAEVGPLVRSSFPELQWA